MFRAGYSSSSGCTTLYIRTAIGICHVFMLTERVVPPDVEQ